MHDTRPVTIALVAGEASGDLLGSHLIAALKAVLPHAEFVGIGGPKMVGQGMTAWWPQEKLAVRGYLEVLKHYREIVGIRKALKRRLLAQRPDVFIGIDAPDFNLDLESDLRHAGIRTVHYVSPSIWAWRAGRIRKIRQAVNRVLCLFPFEPDLYHRENVPATYVGHPLADVLPMVPPRDALREQMKIGFSRPVFAMLPGSRQSEVELHADLFVQTAQRIAADIPEALFLVPLVTRETRELFERAVYRCGAADLPITMMYGHAHEALAVCDVALVASGTATLETALLKRPMVITYKLSRLSWWLMTRKMLLPWVGLPNILCKESVVPELLQDKATPEAISEALLALYRDKDGRAALTERFIHLHEVLRQNTAERAAAAICAELAAR